MNFPELEARHVHTSWESGLEDVHVAAAIEVLRRPLSENEHP